MFDDAANELKYKMLVLCCFILFETVSLKLFTNAIQYFFYNFAAQSQFKILSYTLSD